MSVFAADANSSAALTVAIIALVASVGSAVVAVVGAQRERETQFQAERRELYALLLTALEFGSLIPPPEGRSDYSLLVERVRQVSPEIVAYLDAHVPGVLAPVDSATRKCIREALAYHQKPWISRRRKRILRKVHLASTPSWL